MFWQLVAPPMPGRRRPSLPYIDDGKVSHDEASHDRLSFDEVPHGRIPSARDSSDGASHDVDEAGFHSSATSIPYGPNSCRGSVMHLTDDPEDPEVGRLLVQGDKKEI